ncbi:hypothetical protein PHMEG_00010198 [Phytophthora megakarya]|uniref:Uncharacterized protein n=1 Tax=Phytophthora megakarya TaxID=4795 RepID=A0A225WF88_9STRA|nr:hypothetical protein PHMEG_00010198 [Phytophthora megakarya]
MLMYVYSIDTATAASALSGRNKVPPSPTFVFQIAAGYRVLRVNVEEGFESQLRGQWIDDFVTNNASQKDFQVLASDPNFMHVQLDTAWHKARLREDGQASFVLELYVYVPKLADQSATLRRLRVSKSATEYQLVRIKIQDVPVAMKVNVSDLHAVLELPSYSLRPPSRAPPSTTPPAPVEDIVDVDHLDG